MTTIHNKTDFNANDADWDTIFEKLNEYPPVSNPREETEFALREEWIKQIKATDPEDEVSVNYSVWPPGTKIDVYREKTDGTIIIYEVKAGRGKPLDLYQLKMYWDGLCIQGKQPSEGILLVKDFVSNLKQMVDMMNKELNPPKKTNKYNLMIKTHDEVSLKTHEKGSFE
ncbi:hypothetical protein V7O66_07265 [Methanolobus sp. ZRKC3]|uniref:hypothetical protein n=1 Tax=Methanolobus sp. ZRKC3 TaxID=3125786 RepID=UPI003254E977